MIKALAHVCLLSENLERTLDFYCGTLGLRKKFDFIKDGSLFGFYLEVAPGQFIEVFKTASTSGQPQHPRILHLCLEVDNIDAMRETLVAGGIAVTDKKKGSDQSWQIWCKDPDGTDIEFHEYTDESSQIHETTCLVNW